MRLARISTICLLLVALSCSRKKEYDDRLIFRFNADSGISSLDPAFARDQFNIWGCNQIYNSLVQLDRDLNIQPSLAKKWEIDSTALIYTFYLDKEVYFIENKCFKNKKERAFIADDVLFSFERLRSKELAAPGAWVFQKVDSFEVIDDHTFQIKLKEPFPAFLGILSMKYCSILSKKAVNYYGASYRDNPVGTGPFYLKYWAANEKMILRRNQDYFEKDINGNQLPYLESVAISFIPDKQSAFLEFVKGNLDFISGIDASYKDELLTYSGDLQPKYKDDFVVYRQPYLNTEYLAFLVDSSKNTGNPLLDKRVRQAINFGFDRKKMIRYLRNNIGTPAEGGLVPNGLPGYQSTIGYSYKPELAKQLLEEAGFTNLSMPSVKLQTNASYLDLCEYIQGELINIGIDVKVEVVPPSTLRQSIATSKSPFFRASWIADYPDAENYLSLFYSQNWAPNGPNYSHFKNETFDSLYQQASRETKVNVRLILYQTMDSLVMDAAPVVPLYYDQVLRFYRKNVYGLEGNGMNLLDLKAVHKN